MGCVTVKQFIKTYKKVTIANMSKSRFDTTKVTNDVLKDLFSLKKAERVVAIKSLINSLNKEAKPSFANKVRGLVQLNPAKALIFDGLDGADIRKVGIAFNHVLGSIKAAHDSANVHNVPDTQRKLLVDSTTGLFNGDLRGTAAAIGYEILEGAGFTVGNGLSPEVRNKRAEAIGMDAIRMLESKGFVTINKNSHVVDRGFRDENNERITTGASKILQSPTVSINLEAFNVDMSQDTSNLVKYLNGVLHNNTTTETLAVHAPSVFVAMQASKYVRRLTVPSNITYPSNDNTFNGTSSKDDITTLPTTNEVRKTISNGEMSFNPRFNALFTAINEELLKPENADKQFKDVLVNMGVNITPNVIDQLFFSTSLTDTAIDQTHSAEGKSLSYSTPVKDILESYGTFTSEPFHLTMFIARNARYHQVESVANAQSDSKFTRKVLTGGVHTIDIGSDAFNYMVDSIADEYNMTVEDIINPTDTMLEDIKGFIEAFDGDNLKKQGNFLAAKGNSWAYLEQLSALADIYQANNGKVTTTYMTKGDATASGGLIAIAQAMGYQQAATLFNKLGTDELQDVYGILTNGIEELRNNPDKSVEQEAVLTQLDYLLKKGVLSNKSTLEARTRDMSKYPVMKYLYQQGATGAALQLSREIAIDLINNAKSKEHASKIAELLSSTEGNLDMATALDNAIKNNTWKSYLLNTEGLTDALSTAFRKVDKRDTRYTLSDMFREVLDSKFAKGAFKERNKLIKDILDMAEEVQVTTNSKSVFGFLPAETVLNNKDLTLAEMFKKNMQVPITKIREVITKNGTLINKEFFNATSAIVLGPQSIDAAVLTEAYRRTFKELGIKSNQKYGGTIAIHDAVNANPEFGAVYQKHYIQAFKDINNNYDLVEQYINMVEHFMPKTDINKARIAKFREQNPIEAKQAALSNIDLTKKDGSYIFGYEKTDISKHIDSLSKRTNNSGKAAKPKVTKPKSIVVDEKVTKAINAKIMEHGLDPAIFKTGSKVFAFSTKSNSILVPSKSTLTNKQLEEALEHEITHFKTAAYIVDEMLLKNSANNNIKYVDGTIELIVNNPSLIDSMSEAGKKRILHILSKNSDVEMLAEFIAVMEAEPSVAEELYMALSNDNKVTTANKLKRALKAIIKAVTAFIVSDAKLNALLQQDKIDIPSLAKSINAIVESGQEYITKNDGNVINAALANYGNDLYFGKDSSFNTKGKHFKYREYKGTKDSYSDPISNTMNNLNDYTRNLIINTLEPGVIATFGPLASKANDVLEDKFPMYKATTDYMKNFYEDNAFMQEFKGFLSVGLTDYTKDLRNSALSTMQIAEQNRAFANSTLIANIDKLMIGMSDKEISTLNTAYAKTPLFDIDSEVFARLSDGTLSIEDAIKEAESNAKVKAKQLDDFKALANMYITGETTYVNKDTGSITTVSTYNTENTGDTDAKSKARKHLIALYSLNMAPNGLKAIKDTKSTNRELHDQLYVVSQSLKKLSDKVYENTLDNRGFRGNLITDTHTDPVQLITVTQADLNKNIYKEAEGWKVLQLPNTGNKTYGILYKDTSDESFIEGAGVNISYTKNDVLVTEEVPGYSLSDNNAVRTFVGNSEVTKIVLTNEQKAKLNFKDNPAHSLVRAWSNLQAIADTQGVRDAFLEDQNTFKVYDAKTSNEMVDIIKDKDIDNPFFINLGDNYKTYDSLPREIKTKYTLVPDNITGVKNFKNKVSLVRKDMAPAIVGYKVPVIFKDNIGLRKTAKIWQQGVLLFKIHLIMNNPVKIANDTISNATLLASMGVPIQKMYAYGKEAGKDISSLSALRNKLINARISGNAKAIEKYEKALKDHPIGFALYNGMIQSMGTDVLMKDYDAVSGLQRDIENTLNKILKDSNGDNTGLQKVISSFANFGLSGEDAIRFIGNKAANVKGLKDLGEFTNSLADDIKNIKSEDDMAKYISQYLGSPNSVITRLGSAATQLSDVLPRIVLYKHNIDQGLSEEEAVRISNEAFIDYKVNMPVGIKVLSDYGLLMFPSFWLRIQKVLVNLARDKAGSVAAAAALSTIFEADLAHIVDSNLLNKLAQGGIVGVQTPDIDWVLPTHIL